MLPDELEKRLDGIEDASKKGYPVRNLYKIACEPGLWLQAYVNIRANAGALINFVFNFFFYGKIWNHSATKSYVWCR